MALAYGFGLWASSASVMWTMWGLFKQRVLLTGVMLSFVKSFVNFPVVVLSTSRVSGGYHPASVSFRQNDEYRSPRKPTSANCHHPPHPPLPTCGTPIPLLHGHNASSGWKTPKRRSYKKQRWKERKPSAVALPPSPAAAPKPSLELTLLPVSRTQGPIPTPLSVPTALHLSTLTAAR